MNPELSQFPSKKFYGGRLINAGNVLRYKNMSRATNMMGCSAYTLYQIDGKERQVHTGSIENEAEANAVVQIVDNLRQLSRSPFSPNWCSKNRLRIITFYQAQVSLIKRLLRRSNLGNVHVATVDSSQGCEADYVIISFVRSEGEHKRNTVGFVSDDRRLNVALTRAKYQMICVGNIERIANLPDERAGSVKLLAIDAFNRQCVHSFPLKDPKQPTKNQLNDASNIPNKKRKLEPRERNRSHEGSGNLASQVSNFTNHHVDSKTPSSSSSDSESSVVSSSSSSSDSSNNESFQIQNYKSDVKFIRTVSSSGRKDFTHTEAVPSFRNDPVTKREADFIDIDGNDPIDECIMESEQRPDETDIMAPKNKNDCFDEKTNEIDATTSFDSGVAPSEVKLDSKEGSEKYLHHLAKIKPKNSSILSKTETKAVFENFSF